MLYRRTLIALLFTFLLCSVCSAQVITNSRLDVQVTASDSQAKLVSAGTTQQLAFTADPGSIGGDIFHVVSSMPNATISLIIPGGTEITSANAALFGYSFTTFTNDNSEPVSMPSLINTPGTHTFVMLPPAPAAGSYSIKVVAPSGSDDTLVIASYLSSSKVRAGLVADSQWYRIGQTIVFSALVFNGDTPVTNATVTLAVDDSLEDTIAPVNVTLQDSGAHDVAAGDGIYTGTFTPTRAGKYGAAVRVTGTAGGVSFSRLAGTTFRVQEPLATFDSFSDSGIDDDADGLFDRLRINANLSVQKAGSYQFSVTLVASNGSTIKSEAFANLATGSQQMSISFAAATVLELGVDGPYEIKDAVLTFDNGSEVQVADHRAIVGNTSAYSLSAFDRPPIFVTENKTATGIDTNANGKYDLLRVRAEVLVRTAGDYEWSGTLTDAAGNEIAFASAEGLFTVGSNFITFDFDGSLIGQHGANGPYNVRSVVVFGAGESAIIAQLLETQAFAFKEFENSENLRVGTVAVQETSGNNDGFVEPGENGSLSVQLKNIGGTSITGLNATLSSLTPGVTITSAQSAYANISAGGFATNITPFTLFVSSSITCGQLVQLRLTVHHDGDAGSPSILQFSIQPGRPMPITSVNYSGPPVPVPDSPAAGVNIPITVSGFAGRLKDLNFKFGGTSCSADFGSTTVGFNHSFVGDLSIKLTSPSGTTVTLLHRPGANGVPTSGINFCNTEFDDEGGGAPIQNISFNDAPYTGTFLPAEQLAAFRGEDPNGTWTLSVRDTEAPDTGSVRAFSLILTGLECGSAAPPILSDDFNDNSLDTTRWTANDLFSGFIDLSVPLNETGQRLEIGPLLQNASGSHYRGIRTVNSYDFTGGRAHVELVQPASATTKADAMFTLGYSVDSYYRIYVSEGKLIGQKKVAGVKTTLFNINYDSTNHRYLRIRHDETANLVILETAASTGTGPGTWTSRHSETWNSAVQLAATQFELKAGTWQPETNAPGTVIFDNFEFGLSPIPPAAPVVNAVCPTSGPTAGGAPVTIQGMGFQSGATVRFGGVLATNVHVSSTTTITATTPPHAVGLVNVQVTNTDGQSSTLTNGYQYASLPANVIIEDDFNDSCLDTLKWTANDLFSGFTDPSVPISETAQRLEIGPLLQNAGGSHYRGIRSVSSFDFTGAYGYVELVQPPSAATKGEAIFTIGYSVDSYYRIYVSGGELFVQKKVGGIKTTFLTLQYDSTEHRYLRIRHDTGTNSVVFETAPASGSGPGAWTQRYSETWNPAVQLSAIQCELKGGTWQAETNAPGKVIFDNLFVSR